MKDTKDPKNLKNSEPEDLSLKAFARTFADAFVWGAKSGVEGAVFMTKGMFKTAKAILDVAVVIAVPLESGISGSLKEIHKNMNNTSSTHASSSTCNSFSPQEPVDSKTCTQKTYFPLKDTNSDKLQDAINLGMGIHPISPEIIEKIRENPDGLCNSSKSAEDYIRDGDYK